MSSSGILRNTGTENKNESKDLKDPIPHRVPESTRAVILGLSQQTTLKQPQGNFENTVMKTGKFLPEENAMLLAYYCTGKTPTENRWVVAKHFLTDAKNDHDDQVYHYFSLPESSCLFSESKDLTQDLVVAASAGDEVVKVTKVTNATKSDYKVYNSSNSNNEKLRGAPITKLTFMSPRYLIGVDTEICVWDIHSMKRLLHIPSNDSRHKVKYVSQLDVFWGNQLVMQGSPANIEGNRCSLGGSPNKIEVWDLSNLDHPKVDYLKGVQPCETTRGMIAVDFGHGSYVDSLLMYDKDTHQLINTLDLKPRLSHFFQVFCMSISSDTVFLKAGAIGYTFNDCLEPISTHELPVVNDYLYHAPEQLDRRYGFFAVGSTMFGDPMACIASTEDKLIIDNQDQIKTLLATAVMLPSLANLVLEYLIESIKPIKSEDFIGFLNQIISSLNDSKKFPAPNFFENFPYLFSDTPFALKEKLIKDLKEIREKISFAKDKELNKLEQEALDLICDFRKKIASPPQNLYSVNFLEILHYDDHLKAFGAMPERISLLTAERIIDFMRMKKQSELNLSLTALERA